MELVSRCSMLVKDLEAFMQDVCDKLADHAEQPEPLTTDNLSLVQKIDMLAKKRQIQLQATELDLTLQNVGLISLKSEYGLDGACTSVPEDVINHLTYQRYVSLRYSKLHS